MIPDGIVVAEVHCEGIGPILPGRVFWPRYLAIPFEHVERAVCIFGGFGHKTKRMVTPPFLAFFLEAIDDKFVDFFTLLLLHLFSSNNKTWVK